MITSVTKGRDREIAPKNIRLSKHTDIHWKALEEHFPIQPFLGKAFSDFVFLPKTSVFKELMKKGFRRL
jgi:hypothetical protein